MKSRLLAVASGVALTFPALVPLASAGPLSRDQVAANAKWILHVDTDSLRQSKLGSSLIRQVLDAAGDKMKDKLPIDVAELFQQTGSITAYGSDFKPGPKGRAVMIWRGGEGVEQAVTGLLIQQAQASNAGQGAVRALGEGDKTVYSLNDDAFVAVRPGRGILLSPKADQLAEACGVLDDSQPSLADTETFSEYGALPGGFFFLALAEGFARDLGLPPQAEVLKLAEGGRIALGEDGDNLWLSVSLKARNTADATQIQQVVQGLIALASLTNFDEPGLAQAREWLRGAKVSAQENLVRLYIAVPVETALEQVKTHTAMREATRTEATLAPAGEPPVSPAP